MQNYKNILTIRSFGLIPFGHLAASGKGMETLSVCCVSIVRIACVGARPSGPGIDTDRVVTMSEANDCRSCWSREATTPKSFPLLRHADGVVPYDSTPGIPAKFPLSANWSEILTQKFATYVLIS